LVVQFFQRLKVSIIVGLAAVFLVLGGVAFWLWRRLKSEQKRRVASEAARRFLAEGREKERKRLAREIHDGPVQDLHGLHLHLARKQPNGSNGVEEELMRVTRELRAMSANLHPPALERFGLPAALRSHARRLRDHNDALEIDIQAEIGEESLSEDLRLALFRIAQEAMSNAAQHAAPDRISVEVKCEDPTVSLRVVDDGQGFDVPETLDAKAADGHYGLLGMKERADSVDAALTIRSDPETGTEVEVVAPHHAPEEMAAVA
jgi:signal transduction histidine kinase